MNRLVPLLMGVGLWCQIGRMWEDVGAVLSGLELGYWVPNTHFLVGISLTGCCTCKGIYSNFLEKLDTPPKTIPTIPNALFSST